MALKTPTSVMNGHQPAASMRGTQPDAARNGHAPGSFLHRLVPSTLAHDEKLMLQHIREGRFQRSLALITAFSSLLSGLEVAYEHYVGSYSQQIMYTPVFFGLTLFFVGIVAAFNRWAARVLLPIVSLFALLDGVVGFFMHVRGIARKPGGWRLPIANIVMGPPIFAPLLFATSGFLGFIATFLRREDDLPQTSQAQARSLHAKRSLWADVLPQEMTREVSVAEHDIREGRFQRALGIATAISAFFSGFEALYSHYKNNFSYRVEWVPILLTPLVMFAGIGSFWNRAIARTLLPFTSALALLSGAIGFFYHVRGVLRRPGGSKKPLYNILYGPPVFAPLLFAATGFLGLLASLLRRAK
ncbi:MAG TPA: hypothetical protein VHZ51_06220 [Ktedonobacteraceae bacterium]|nr:hypothetical protein [Ktedonobacteraceae bacterium]